MTSLRVLHVLPSWMPLTQPWLYNEIRFLPDTTSHVACKMLISPERFPWPNLHVLPGRRRLDRWRGPDAVPRRRARALVRLAKSTKAQVLHSHFGNIGWEDHGAASAAGLPHFVSFYGQDLTRFPRLEPAWTGRYREVLQSAAGVLCEGPHMAKVVRAIEPSSRTIVQPLGVEVDHIPFQPRVLRKGEPLRILLAGTFREKKGFPDALRAIELAGVPFEVTVIGDAGKDPAEQAEKKAIADLLARPAFTGRHNAPGYVPLDELMTQGQRHHVFLSPSMHASDGDTEGGAPLTIIEMAASGMPVVSTTHCDIPAVLAPESARLLAPERDPQALADRLRWLYHNPGEWGRIAAANRRHAEANHDCRRQGQRLRQTYVEAL